MSDDNRLSAGQRSAAMPCSAMDEKLRASMIEVAKMLRESADQCSKMSESMRYDEPRGIRHAMDVHRDFLRDMAAELERPGRTKYSPNTD